MKKKFIPNEGEREEGNIIIPLSTKEEIEKKIVELLKEKTNFNPPPTRCRRTVTLLLPSFIELFPTNLTYTRDVEVTIQELKKGIFVVEAIRNYNYGPSVVSYYWYDGLKWNMVIPKEGNWISPWGKEITPDEDREFLGVPDDVTDFKWYWRRLGLKTDNFGHPLLDMELLRNNMRKWLQENKS